MQVEHLAEAIEYDIFRVVCISPCCKKKVIHGSCRGNNFDGWRMAHCCDGRYYVKKTATTKKVNKVRNIQND